MNENRFEIQLDAFGVWWVNDLESGFGTEHPFNSEKEAQAAAMMAAASSKWNDAGLSVYAAWDSLKNARTPIQQATAMMAMDEAMHDLSTWLPGYNYETGEVHHDELH